eukprot:7536305-Ditylum_brightwellii.AAC.1
MTDHPTVSRRHILCNKKKQAVKQFAKEVEAPDIMIYNSANEKISKSLKWFLGEIGTTLRVLEEGTLWANKVKLYIGLIDEAVPYLPHLSAPTNSTRPM